jgi:RND superfamily putative drug exporter
LAIAVFVMLITGLTLVPALVSLIGPATFWPSKAWRREPKGTAFARIGAAVGRRPAVAAIASGLVLFALAGGVLLFKADYDFAAGFPSTTESAKAAADLERGFPQGALDPTEAYLTTIDGGRLTPAQLDRFAAAKAVGGAGGVQPPVTAADGTVARFALPLTVNPASNEAITLVHDHLRPPGSCCRRS